MTDAKGKKKVELTSWQLAQLERLVEDHVNQLKHDGLGKHALTLSLEALLKVLNES